MKIKACFILLAILLLLAACSSNTANPQSKEMTVWLESARLAAQETPKQLYEAAQKENTLVIYSDTTRVLDVKKSFEEKYPGLTVEVQDIRANDLIDALRKNYREQKYFCDIAICTDSDTSLSGDLIPNGILYKYVPYDMSDKILPDHNTDQFEFLGEGEQLFYNSEVYETPPVTNWWELTEPRFKGKVYIPNPLRSQPAFALICSMIQNSNAMSDAYRQLYGKDLVIPEDSCAGEVFWKRLVENDIQFANSSDEVVEAVGTLGQTDPPLGIMISSKARKSEIGFAISPVFDIEPKTGVYTPNSIMIAGGAKNVNSAKLFIRWLLGEADGTGEGYKPYLQNGTWPVRGDVKSQSPVSLEQANFWRIDKKYVSENKERIMKFWLSLLQ